MIKHPVSVAGILLALFATAGTALVAVTNDLTADKIAANEREALLRSLVALVPAESIDNDIVTDTQIAHQKDLLGSDETLVYLGRKQGKPVAAVFSSVVPNGYSGPIKLLVAVRTDGTLGGVRVVSHKETPGLGDKVEENRSDWIYSFNGKSLSNPEYTRWKVKKDGGDFDQFTGATITPRAIVNAVKNTLMYFDRHGESLFMDREKATKK
ncbi:electron transport complex subunit RsxG [Sedimenticola selenatireducens]|uniref:Ion-translocating oxidoreductase complex subunit G n=1 Tax=Sedimenticola selenatireducens TaxID=191960 RepID=A0A557SCV0_9GAMM|nr:electron transport complex subunit RsxG [Sedimenticola selenatireducens]TVO75224.1 electron transport complex subunit RsxG [Sedimenticola selenatireducens]TVT66922.1 MAG: electron transport complex subunit RsxG [Sedimenticola selenatireducens]